MDTTKQNQPTSGQDSDDLIAELARLVAQDARNTSAQSEAYKREEPRFAPEPEPEATADEHQDAPYSEAAAPTPDRRDDLPGFDFGFAPEPEQASVATDDADPIAHLIADAEVEAYDRDLAEEPQWFPEPAPGPEPVAFEASYSPRVEQPRFDHYSSAPADYGQDRDPLREIEALIGEAARVEPIAEPSLPPGRRVKSSYLDDSTRKGAVDAAESAILAAAAATGASVQRMEPEAAPVEPRPTPAAPQPEPYVETPRASTDRIPDPLFAARPSEPMADDGDYEEFESDPSFETGRARRRISGFVLPVIGGVAIVAVIAGAYFAFFSGPNDSGEAPLLTADAQPLKQDVEPSRSESAASDSVVFSEIEGNTARPEDEALVSRDQTDGATGAQIAQVLAPEEGETALVNRPVRTVTVRPDGTIVTAADDSVAGSNVLPVDRPNVPAVPNSTLTADPIGEAIAQAMSGDTAFAAAPAETQVAALDPTPLAAETTAPVTDTTAPQPVARPAGLSATPAMTTPAPAAPTTTALATEPTQPAAASSAPAAWVQLSSQRSEEVARAGMAELQTRYGALFNGVALEVSRVDLGDRGVYYRVRLPQTSLAEANATCGAIQGQGGDCFVLNN